MGGNFSASPILVGEQAIVSNLSGETFVLAVGAMALALLGPGEWSIDHALGIADALDGWVGAAIAGGGLVAAVAQLAVFFRSSRAA